MGLLAGIIVTLCLYAIPVGWKQDHPSHGRLITAGKTEPKTFNPVTAFDIASREVIQLTTADLVHINRRSLETEPALAESWSVSPDGRTYTIHLRHGLRFSDGHPMDADDVVFSFQVYLDQAVGSAQRDLLVIRGKPIQAEKLDPYTVQFQLSAPYAAAERLFDGIAILPRHLLLRAYQEGRLSRAWALQTPPDQIAGLGPFRLKEYVPGERVVLQRNPYYWKTDGHGRRLPYLNEIVIEFLPSEDVQMVRFLAGQMDIISNLSAENFLELKKHETSRRFRAFDLGSGLEYNFLVFNLNDLGGEEDASLRKTQSWFRHPEFRKALAAAIDREAIVRLVYHRLADPMWGIVPPGNSRWINHNIPCPRRSVSTARELLRSAGFSWKEGKLLDPQGDPVAFSILTSASNSQRTRMATLIQQDMAELGISASVSTLEFRAMLNRILDRREYETAIMALASGDADPNSEMNVWLSNGSMHMWNLANKLRTPAENEIDRLMHLQMTTLNRPARKALYDRVQELMFQELPIVCLASPHVLVAATDRVGNFDPAILRPYTLWNAESLYLRERTGGH